MGSTEERAGLVAFFGRTADECADAVAEGAGPDLAAVRRYLVPALAVLRTLAGQPDVSAADLSLARSAASDAAAACRTQPPTDALAGVVASFENVVVAAAAALGCEPAIEPAWERFLFTDVDVEVRRDAHGWLVRAAGETAGEPFLDAALERVLTASPYRIAQVTVQILDWVEHRAPYSADD